MRLRVLEMLAIAGVACATACASNPARSAATVPLEIPEPPPRAAIDPLPAVDVPQTERPPTVLAPAPTVRANPPPAVTAGTASASPVPVLPQPAIASPEPPRTAPPAELRPGGPPGRTPSAAQVREALVRTKKKLDSIDRRRLNAGQRADFDSARRFLGQAESAVKANNLLLADSSVEKAETLADGLK